MSRSKLAVGSGSKAVSVQASDMFAHLPPADPFEIKRDEIAANLSALISFSNKSRSEIADALGYHKSAVTRILSGRNNTQIKTLWEIASILGYEFDVVFHRGDVRCKSLQPWHQTESAVEVKAKASPTYVLINLQTPGEVARDIRSGYAADQYFSFPKMQGVSIEEATPITSATTVNSKALNPTSGITHVLRWAQAPHDEVAGETTTDIPK